MRLVLAILIAIVFLGASLGVSVIARGDGGADRDEIRTDWSEELDPFDPAATSHRVHQVVDGGR